MADVTIQPMKSGPYQVTGTLKLIDGEGKEYEVQESMFLCRCGNSGHKPFCDGSHRRVGFVAEEAAP